MSLKELLPRSADKYHHAYAIFGSTDGLADVLDHVFSIPPSGHPDLYRYQADTLTVSDAREICELQARRPLCAERTVFLIDVKRLPSDVQNTLLKVFEDPAASTLFFLVLPPRSVLLPTLRSRVHTLVNTPYSAAGGISASTFLSSSPAERIKLVAPIIDAKDKKRAEELLDNIELAVVEDGQYKTEKGLALRQSLRTLYELKGALKEPGSSTKLVLEFIALRFPRIAV